MQNRRYKLSSLAQAHLQQIKQYTVENFSETQWQKYKTSLLTGFQMLADNADLGRSCDEICSGGFYFPVAKHMAYYIKENDFILIVAVLGQAQIPRNHL